MAIGMYTSLFHHRWSSIVQGRLTATTFATAGHAAVV